MGIAVDLGDEGVEGLPGAQRGGGHHADADHAGAGASCVLDVQREAYILFYEMEPAATPAADTSNDHDHDTNSDETSATPAPAADPKNMLDSTSAPGQTL